MEKEIEIDGQRVNYSDSGMQDAPTIILLHGWGCNLHTLDSITAIFGNKMRVIAIDMPGHGKSPDPAEVWGIESYTALLEKMLRKLGINKPSLLGHSFGGRISILYASRNDVDKVVLVDAAGIKPRRSLKYYFKVYSYKAVRKSLPYLAGRAKAEEILDRYRRKVGSSDYAQSTAMMRRILSKVVNEDLKFAMPSIKAPTLLVWGENDTATPLRDAKTMEKLIPDAGLVSFPGCGHYSFLDNPGGFRAVIKSFFKNELK